LEMHRCYASARQERKLSMKTRASFVEAKHVSSA